MTKKTQKKIRYALFASTFSNWMIQRKLSQRNVAQRLQINQSIVSRFCTGDRLPSLPVFLRLIGILKKEERAQFIAILNQQLEVDKCKNYLTTQ